MVKKYDIAIIGAGPAGLSAAIYGTRAGRRGAGFEGKRFGGQIINTPEIENYPGIERISGAEFAMNLYNQAVSLGAEYINEKVIEVEDGPKSKRIVTNHGEYEAKSVIVATGVKKRPLGLEHEEELIGRGISYCATCDGAFFRGRNVAVVGGGNTALEDAMFLSNYCNRVYLIHRRDTFRGEGKNVESVKEKDNINVIYNSIPIRLIYDDVLEGMEIKNVTSSEVTKIDVDGVFVAIGQIPDSEIFKDLLKTDPSGYIVANEDCKTNIEGIFTAGDCREKNIRQLATAASDGAVAAINACSFIDENYS